VKNQQLMGGIIDEMIRGYAKDISSAEWYKEAIRWGNERLP
jgi:hypothetical protein